MVSPILLVTDADGSRCVVIESVDLVVAALAAGAAAGVTDTASAAVKDAYQGL